MKNLYKIFLIFVFISSYAYSQNNPSNVQQPIERVLNLDGTVIEGMQGSFDARGYQIVSKPGETPKFSKSIPNKIFAVFNNFVDAVAVDGSGNIYAAGRFTSPFSYIAKWNGTSWVGLGSGMNSSVNSLAVIGSYLYAGGGFSSPAMGIARWDGASWSAVGTGGPGTTVYGMKVSGTDLYVAGNFSSPSLGIAKWNGTTWSGFGSGLGNTGQCIAVNGTDVYVGGMFTTAGGVSANHVAKWDGAAWSALGAGVNATLVTSMEWYGGKLYVSGNFTTPFANVAVWDGATWSNGGASFNSYAQDMLIIGSDLYIGGAASSPTAYIAKYNGSTWSQLGSSVNSTVFGMADYGSNLVVCGVFSNAGGTPTDYIARWDGTNWFACPGKPVLTSSAATNVRNTSATLNGGVNPNTGNTSIKFIFGTSTGNLLDSSMTPSPSSTSGYSASSTSASVTGLTPNTTYYYRVRAWNSYGKDSSAVISFTTPDKPAPTSAAATSILSTTATLNGSVIANNDVSTVKFILGTSIGNLIDSSMVVTPSTVSGAVSTLVSATVSGLSPSTTYYYRVRAWNAYGIDSSGTVQSFTTLPAPTATAGSVTGLNSVSATLNGTVNAQNHGTLNVIFRYGLNIGNTQLAPLAAAPSTATGGTNTAVANSLSGLTPSTTYYFRVGIVRGTGDTIWSIDQSFATPAAPTATASAASSINSVSATLNGTVNANNNGTLNVIYRYGFGTGNTQNAPVTAAPSTASGATNTSVSCNIAGLTPNSTYYCRVGIVRGTADTIWSTDQSFITPLAPTSTTGAVTNLNSVNVTLNGSVNANNNGTLNVIYRYGTGSGNTQKAPISTTPSTATAATNTSVSGTITGLTPATTYYYRIGIVRATADTIWCTEQNFTTLAAPTSTATGLTNLNSVSVILDGTVNASNNGTLDVIYRYGLGSGNSQNGPVAASPSTATGVTNTVVACPLTGLTPATTYYYRIGIVRAIADTIWCTEQNFTTPAAPTSTANAVTNLNSVRVTLNGTVNANNNGTLNVIYRYGLASGNSQNAPIGATPSTASGASNSAVTCPIAGLLPTTTYYYRIGIVRAAGDTIWCSEQNFTTPAVPASTTNAVTNLNSVSVTLNGTVNANNNGTLNVVYRYGLGTGNSQNAPIAATPSTASGSSDAAVSCPISGLTPNTAYYYRVGIVRGAGDTIYSADGTFSTPLAPTSITSAPSNLKSTSVTLQGSVNANNNGSLDVVLRYGTGSGNSQNAPINPTPGTATAATPTTVLWPVTGLSPNTLYYYRFGIVRAIGDTIWSTEANLTTPLAPTAVTGSAAAVTSVTATINGTVHDNNDGSAPLNIVFRYGEFPATGNNLQAPFSTTPSASVVNTLTTVSAALSGLSGNTQYNYMIGIVRNVGDTIWGSEMSFTTQATISGILQNSGGGKISGITIRLKRNGTDTLVNTSASDGSYIFNVGAGGNYTVVPDSISNNYHFVPDTIGVTIAGANIGNQNFNAIRLYSLSGWISNFTNGDTVKLIGSPTVNSAAADFSGNYYFTKKIDSNTSYVIQPTKYSFNSYPYSPNTTYTLTNMNGDSTAKNFKAAKLILTSPVGGTSWQPFTPHNITWTSINYSGNVDLYYSTNSGSSFMLIASGIPYDTSAGRYSWIVPNTSSNNCMIKIVEQTGVNSITFDYFSNNFIISTAGALTSLPGTINNIINLGQKSYDTITVKNSYAIPRNLNQIQILPQTPPVLNQTYRIIQNSAPVTINPFDSIKVIIEITGDTIGYFGANVKMQTDGIATDSLLNVLLTGTVKNGLLSKNKNSIDFSLVYLGRKPSNDTLKINNYGTTPITFKNPHFSQASSRFTSTSLIDTLGIPPNSTGVLIVNIDPTVEGDFRDTLILDNNSLNFPNLKIPVHAAVIQPAIISLNKRSIDFGQCGFMTNPKDSIIVIQNVSQHTDLTIDSVTSDISDSIFIVLKKLPIKIGPNSSDAITVRFTLNKVGIYSRKINLFNSSDAEPRVSIPLSGEVISTAISVTPKTINFGSLGYLCDPKDTLLSISNTGPYKLNFSFVEPIDSSFVVKGDKTPGGIFIDPGATYSGISVKFLPNKLGIKTDTLRILSNATNSPLVKVVLTGNVIPTSLAFSETNINFGTTSVSNPIINKTLLILNSASIPITIYSKNIIGDSLSFLTDQNQNNQNITLMPGQTDSLVISFFPRTLGPKNASLKIVSNDSVGRIKYITLYGNCGGKPVISSSVTGMGFGEILVGQIKDTTIDIRNIGNVDLNITDKTFIGEDKNLFSIITGGASNTLQMYQTETVGIRIKGDFPLGSKSAQISVASNDSTNSPFNINLNAYVKAPVLVQPAAYIGVDSLPIGRSIDTIINLMNNGNYLLQVYKVYFDGPAGSDFKVLGISESIFISPNESKNIVVRFTPSQLGPRDSRLVIISSDPANPEIFVRFQGAGSENPIIYITQNPLNFGFVDSNKTKDLDLGIKNSGFSPLTISSMNISGVNSNQFSIINRTFPFIINPSDSIKVKVRYTSKSSIGNPSAKLQILSNDLKNQVVEIKLLATSSQPVMTIDSLVVFSAINPLDSAQKDLVISNNSSVYFIVDSIYFDNSGENPFRFNNIKFPLQIDPAGKYSLTIIYNPKTARNFTSYLNVISLNALNNPSRVKITGSTNKPVISVLPNLIDFKYVELNKFKDTTLTIGNTGQAGLKIDSLNFNGTNSNLFMTVGVSLPFIIDPSKTRDITIRFFPGQNKSNSLVSLKILSNDLDKPSVSVSLSGTGDQPAIASDSLVDFGRAVIYDSLKSDLKISNTSQVNLRIDSISVTLDSNKAFSCAAMNVPFIIAPKTSISLNLKFSPILSKNYSAYLNIYSSDPAKIPFKIKLTGSTAAPRFVLPAIVSYGKIRLDSSKTSKIILENSGDGYLLLSSMVLSGKDTSEFKILPKSIPLRIEAGKTDSLFIQFNPKSSGKKDIKLIILSNNPTASNVLLIDAEGINQFLASDPSSVNFGDVTYTMTKRDSIILHNQGSGNLDVNLVSMTGSNPGLFKFINIDPSIKFTLIPNSKKTIIIEFTPDSLGSKSAAMEILSTDPVNPKIVIPFIGNCITPVITSSINQVNFGNLRVGKSKDSMIVIRNAGKADLMLKGVFFSGKDSSEFTIVKFNLGKIISSGGFDTVLVRFNPLSSGDKAVSLLIKSNDFNYPNITLTISGKGIIPKMVISSLGIDFGKLFIIRTRDTSISVNNAGLDNLVLKNISLSGSDSLKFMVTNTKYSILKNIILSPGETQIFQIRFYPQSTGKMSARLSIESDDPSLPVNNVPLTGEGFIPDIVMDNDLIANENIDKVINFHLTDDFTPKSVKVFYKIGGNNNYDSVSLLSYSHIFNKNLITKNGLDFYIKISWDGAVQTIPQSNYAKFPLSLQIKLAELKSAFALLTKSYSMVTVPLLFQSTTLLNEMIRNLEGINNSSWRIFKYRNGYYEEYIDETTWKIQPGDGFWLIAKDNKVIDFQNCITVPTGQPYMLTLQPGWNQIGSPFLFNVPFGNITIPSGKSVENVIWAWNGDDGYKIETANLSPWVGYFIKNNEPDTVNITISAASTHSLVKMENITVYQPDEWKMIIESDINGRKNQNAEIGCIRNSSDDWDPNDVSEPPEIDAKYSSVRFPHNEWNGYKGNYARDYRAISKDGKTWDMEIMNLTGSRDAEIRFTVQGNLPKDYQTILFDYNLNKSFKITNSHKFKFNESEQERKFKLLVGTKEYVDNNKLAEITPQSFKLSQNYPNPFNPSTMISYQLPISNFVTLRIYDLMGRVVANLVSENQAAGNYEVQWKANEVPSGIYYYRIQAGSFSDIKKMLLLK